MSNKENIVNISKETKKTVKKNASKNTKISSDTSTTENETEPEKDMEETSNIDEEETCIISLDKTYRVLGYKEKRLAIKLLNGKYNFVENVDYKVINGVTMITPQCFRLLCLLSRTDYGNEFRRFIVAKMFEFMKYQKLEINYEICPIPEVHFDNLEIFENKKVFYMINIKDDQYIYGITTDISMLVSILKERYYVIINKIWILNDTLPQDKLMNECKVLFSNEQEFPKVDKIKSCFRTSNIYDLLVKINCIIKKLNN